MKLLSRRTLVSGGLFLLAGTGTASELVSGQIETDLVRSPVEYYALLPPGYSTDAGPYPLVVNLHGGGGDRERLKDQQAIWDELWDEKRIPPMVVVMPSALKRGFYLDLKDGSQQWETFLIGPFLDHLRQRFNLRSDARGTMLTGASMGGMGSLRLAFKYPEKFGAVAGMEPGTDPVMDWDELRPKHRFWRSDALMEQAFGKPIDKDYYAANNPAWIVAHDAEKIRSSGLKIMLDAGDEDMYWLHEATQFLHEVLWDYKIRHEYHLYLGADHIGPSLAPRMRVAFEFLGRTLSEPVQDPRVAAGRKRLAPRKAVLDEVDHYGIDAHLIEKE